MIVPTLHCFSLLVLPVVALVDSGDARAGTSDVVEHSFGHFKSNV